MPFMMTVLTSLKSRHLILGVHHFTSEPRQTNEQSLKSVCKFDSIITLSVKCPSS